MDEHKAGLTGVATGVVDGLKNQPVLLVIVVLNVLMIGVQAWTNSAAQASRVDLVNKLIERCGPVIR